MTEIDVGIQYSGFVVFTSKLLSIATGLTFQLMIARTLTAEEYGIWFNVNDMLAYFILFAGVLPFWAMRFASKGAKGAVKTGMLANFSVSVIATILYLIIIGKAVPAFGVERYFYIYMIGSIQIIEYYLISASEEFLRAKKPQAIGYGILTSELFKVVLGYITIVVWRKSLLGVMISIVSAIAVQLLYYFVILKRELQEKLKIYYIKEWFKGSILNLYSIAGAQIANSVFILLFVYGGEKARGYYGAATQIATVITYSSFLAFALYPKLLSEGKTQNIAQSLKTVLMFALPMTVGILIMSDSYLVMLKGEYIIAQPILMILAVDALLATLSNFLSFVLYGLERVDEKLRIPITKLVRSKIFIGFSLVYLQAALTVPTTFFALKLYDQGEPLWSAITVAKIITAARFVVFIALYCIVSKVTRIEVPWRNILRSGLASAAMALFLYLIPHPERLHQIVALTILGGSLYMGILFIIDKEVKILITTTLSEIKSKVKFSF